MEPAYKVLKTNTTAHQIWKDLLTIVNSLIVALLIVVAFVEILHINVDTYGVKKILPTLILAVIAANFSYILVRLLVDIANVVITVFSKTDKITGMINNPDVFAFPEFEWSSWFSNLLINLVLFAAAIMMYVLAFLFVIRNWVIYFLAIVSPIAFMAMVLPQTKSLFNQWWQNVIRWVFMPVVSIGLLWLAAQMTTLIKATSIMGAVIVGTLLYFAITMPFKLGGSIMSNFTKFTGAKWAAGTAGKYWGQRAANIPIGAWQRFRKAGLNLQREGIGKEGTALNRFSKFVGRNWIGTGMDKVNADKAHNEQLAKGIGEGVQARRYLNKGDKFQIEREWMKNREGEIGEFEKYAQERLLLRGEKNPDDKIYNTLVKFRSSTALAKQRMEHAEKGINSIIQGGTTFLLNSGSRDEKYNDKEFEDKYGITKKEADKLIRHFNNVQKNYNESSEESNKAISNMLKIPYRLRVPIHNVAELKINADQLARILGDFAGDFDNILSTSNEQERQTLTNDVATRRNLSTADRARMLQDLKVYGAVGGNSKTFKRLKAETEKLARDTKAITVGEDIGDIDVVKRVKKKADKNHDKKIEQLVIEGLIKKDETTGEYSDIDPMISDLVTISENKKSVTFNKMRWLQANRARIFLSKDRREKRAEWSEQYDIKQLADALKAGLVTEGVEVEDLIAAHYHDVDGERRTGSVLNASVILDALQAAMKSGNAVDRQIAARGYMGFLGDVKDSADIAERTGRIFQFVGETDLKRKEFEPIVQSFEEITTILNRFDPSSVAVHTGIDATSEEERIAVRKACQQIMDGTDEALKTALLQASKGAVDGILGAMKNMAVQQSPKLVGALVGEVGRPGESANG